MGERLVDANKFFTMTRDRNRLIKDRSCPSDKGIGNLFNNILLIKIIIIINSILWNYFGSKRKS
jgi:hypothetical protein